MHDVWRVHCISKSDVMLHFIPHGNHMYCSHSVRANILIIVNFLAPSDSTKFRKYDLLLDMCFEQNEYSIHLLDFQLLATIATAVWAIVTIALPTWPPPLSSLSSFWRNSFQICLTFPQLKHFFSSWQSCSSLTAFIL